MPSYSRRFIKQHLHCADTAKTTADRGKAYEDLALYLFGKIPGLSHPRRNKRNKFHTEEIDLAFWNDLHPAGLRSFKAIILVECKNWSKPVGSMEVSWFITKIRDSALDFGILLAAKGITGNAQDRAEAHQVVAKALKDGVRMIVITREEIEGLKASQQLVEMIKEKLCDLHVTGTVWP
jgi:hypothetical protein